MKHCLFVYLLLLAATPLFSQTEKPASVSPASKGAAPLPQSTQTPLSPPHGGAGGGATRAVIVGISDYQDPAIPDLQFADRDAEAFANFLRSPAGGSLDGDHLKLLTNKDATTAQFDAALGWLIDESKEGDQAIIYFSGHGDVETRTRSQQGFLLCWDSPPQAYVSGAYPIFFLKEVVSTLSLENKAKVIIITDACRSGKLAGNAVGGSQLTSQNLAQQFANEIKILSCQPNEYSIEGEQWGGGRGAFSFHLVDGLYGMADGNADASVNLMEIGRYLDDHVTTEVAPESQVPMTVGNRTEKLAAVFPDLLAQVRKNKAGQLTTFSSTDSKDLEEEILATVDTTIRELYRLFKQSIKDKVFLEPAEACADAYYEQLIGEPKLKRLHNSMRRNYAAALQDDAQQVMNLYMKTDLKEHVLINKTIGSYLTHRQLERAAELLGTGHYMYRTIKSRQYVYEAAYITFGDEKIPESTLAKAFALCRKSLEYEPDSPFPYFLMSLCYAETQQIDSVQLMIQQANRFAPLWVIPNLDAASILSGHKNYEAAKLLLEQATSIDSTKAHVWAEWGHWYFSQQMYPDANSSFKKAIVLDSTLAYNWSNLGLLYITTEQYEEGEIALKKAISIDSSMALTWGRLGNLYRRTQRYAEAEVALKKAISLSPDWTVLLDMLGSVYNTTQRYSEAAPLFLHAIALDSTNMLYWSRLSYAYLQSQRYAEAEAGLLKTLALDSTHATSWNNLGFTYLYTQRYDAAEQALQKAIALNPELANSHKHLATVYLRLNRLDEARKGYQKSMAINSNYVGGYLGMAYLHTREKDFDKALDYVKQAIEKGASYDMLSKDEDLADLRSNREWGKMMRRYFPEKTND